MSKRQLTLLAISLVMLPASVLRGQINDHQYFAPAVWEDLGRPRGGNSGYFATVHRMNSYMSRPEDTTRLSGADGGDWTWGNRLDVGYMTEASHGWLFSGHYIENPDMNDLLRHPQIGLVNEEFNEFLEGGDDGGGGGGGGGGGDGALPLPAIGGNNPLTNQRDFDALSTINSAKLTSIELMKTYRLPALRNRGFVEAMCGMRYIKLNDTTRADTYGRGMLDMAPAIVTPVADTVITLPGGGVIVIPNPPILTPGPLTGGITPVGPLDPNADVEFLTVDSTRFLNHMMLAQIGMRAQIPQGRSALSAELRAFCGNNWQEFNRVIITDSVVTEDGEDIMDHARAKVRVAGNLTEFVFGADARAEAAYYVTRNVALSAGLHYQYLAKGVGRGNVILLNEQSFGALSVVFGVAVNR